MLKQTIEGSRLYFSASHFLLGYGKCERLHGHDYKITCSLTYSSFPDDTLDFTVLKQIVHHIVNDLDHKILLASLNKSYSITKEKETIKVDFANKKHYIFPLKDVVILTIPAVTCENLAKLTHKKIGEKIIEEIHLIDSSFNLCVSIAETVSNKATYCQIIE